MVSATLGVIFVYPTDGLPDEVTMEWDLFSDRIQVVPTTATDEEVSAMADDDRDNSPTRGTSTSSFGVGRGKSSNPSGMFGS